MPLKSLKRLFTTVPILALTAYLLRSHLHQKSSSKPIYSSKPVMITKTAQLGGTASNVAVGKIGVSALFLFSYPR